MNDIYDENNNRKALEEITRLNNELISMHRDMAKKNAQLKHLNKLKTQFLAMAVHDIRNPLGNIYSLAEFLNNDSTNLTDWQSDFVKSILQSSTDMLNLLNELLDVTTIESGAITIKLAEVDLADYLSGIIKSYTLVAQRKNISLHLDNKTSTKVHIDAKKIEQVIGNLITNAIKYSNPDTNVTLGFQQQPNGILIYVKDEGLGIPEKEKENLFKAFQKTSTKSTAGEKSTGLGLFICKRIVEAHNGKIWAESQPGLGSTFYFLLPI